METFKNIPLINMTAEHLGQSAHFKKRLFIQAQSSLICIVWTQSFALARITWYLQGMPKGRT